MTKNKRFTLIVEDDGYWIRDESDFKIIATGLKLGVASNLIAYLNELNEENQELKRLIKRMGELGGFNKHLIKTICGDLE